MWRNGQYYYSTRVLKAIVESYTTIYEGLPLSWGVEIYNPWSLAEFKADFDIALNEIGRGEWSGVDGVGFKDFRHYGRLQQVIIAGILGVDDYELEKLGFYDISRLRGFAFYLMKKQLNGS